MRILVSDSSNPSAASSKEIFRKDDLLVNQEFETIVDVKLPAKSRRNGTLWAHAILLSTEDRKKNNLDDAETKLVRTTSLTAYQPPEAEAFKLVSEKTEMAEKSSKKSSRRPVAHLRSKLFVSIVDQPLILPLKNLPSEIIRHIQLEIQDGTQYYAPLFHLDEMSFRIKDLVEVWFIISQFLWDASRCSGIMRLVYVRIQDITFENRGIYSCSI